MPYILDCILTACLSGLQGISDGTQQSPPSDGQGVANSASEGADEADYSSSDMSIGALK